MLSLMRSKIYTCLLLLGCINLFPARVSGTENAYSLEQSILQSQISMNDNDFDEARNTLEDAIYTMPNEPKLYFYLGSVLRELGWLEEAISAYQTAILIHPGYLGALEGQADVYRMLEKWEKAIETYDKIINIDPTSASPFFEKALVYRNQGHLGLEMEALKQSYQRNPDFVIQSARLLNYEIDELLSQINTATNGDLKSTQQTEGRKALISNQKTSLKDLPVSNLSIEETTEASSVDNRPSLLIIFFILTFLFLIWAYVIRDKKARAPV